MGIIAYLAGFMLEFTVIFLVNIPAILNRTFLRFFAEKSG
jgi:hypothetical protein